MAATSASAELTSCENLLETIEGLYTSSQWQSYIELCAEQELKCQIDSLDRDEGDSGLRGSTPTAKLEMLREYTAERLREISDALLHSKYRPEDEALLHAIARSYRHCKP